MQTPIVCAALLLLPAFSHAQISEHFNLSHVPWQGTDTAWQISNGRLQSNCMQPNSNFWLWEPAGIRLPATWEWWMQLDFNTSSNNYTDVYLMADSSNLLQNGPGYFIRIGDKDDDVCLYKKHTADSIEKLIDGRNDLTNKRSSVLRLKVSCDDAFSWQLWVDTSGTGFHYTPEGAAKGSAVAAPVCYGIVVRQSTASFFRKHFFDDVTVAPLVKDTLAPELQSVTVLSDRELLLRFSEPPDNASAFFAGHYSAGTAASHPVNITLEAGAVRLVFAQPFPAGDSLLLQVEGISDAAGNKMVPVSIWFMYYPDAVLFSELLFDPKPLAPEFVEIHNHGATAVDLQELYINAPERDTDRIPLSRTQHLLLPGQYIALTRDPDALCRYYTCKAAENLLKVSSLPALPNEGGALALYNASGHLLDLVRYSPDMQSALTGDAKGVSLERLSFQQGTLYPGNWHPAAITAGYATPGTANSQQLNLQELPGEVTVQPPVFSPDNDGMDDVAVIACRLPQAGFVGNITVFDALGRPVRRLLQSGQLGNQGNIIWDGLGENKLRLPVGIYIIFTEIFDLQGRIKRWKLPVVVARKLN